MDQTYKNYIKLSFIKAQLQKHVHFQQVKSKFPNLQFAINAQIIANTNAQIGKIGTLKLREIQNEGGSLFYQQNPKWECIQLEDKFINTKPQLQLHFSISKNQTAIGPTINSAFVNFISEMQKQSAQIKFPINLPLMVITLQPFLNQPYKAHSINLDFRIPKQQKFTQNTKQTGERDGMVTFELSFLQKLRTQLQIKNLSLKTKEFSKLYKLGIYQVSTNRANKQHKKIQQAQKQLNQHKYFQTIHPQRKAREVYQLKQLKSGFVEIPLQVHGWEQFQSNESFKSPIALSLAIINEQDEIGISLQYQTIPVSSEPIKNAAVNFISAFTKQMNNTSQSKKVISTAQNLIKLENLLGKRKGKKGPHAWTKQQININSQAGQFSLQFEFMIKLRKGLQSQRPQSQIFNRIGRTIVTNALIKTKLQSSRIVVLDDMRQLINDRDMLKKIMCAIRKDKMHIQVVFE